MSARRAAAALFLALVFAPGARAGDAPAALGAADRAAIRAVIEAQLAAFARDDAEAAFAFAAPAIQAKFGDAETFLAMVRAAYRPVWRPAETRFRALETSGARPVQEVFIVGPDGAAWIALYPMVRGPGGAWRIAGCVLAPWSGARAEAPAPRPGLS